MTGTGTSVGGGLVSTQAQSELKAACEKTRSSRVGGIGSRERANTTSIPSATRPGQALPCLSWDGRDADCPWLLGFVYFPGIGGRKGMFVDALERRSLDAQARR